MTNTADIGLPPLSFFRDIEVPEFDRKYVRRQGPASVKKDVKGRTFTASGPKADAILRIIFADEGLTRAQIAVIVGCSPSRVTEVAWALDEAVRKGQITSWPEIPRKPRTAEEAETDAESTAVEDV